jgi:hypothetical protein
MYLDEFPALFTEHDARLGDHLQVATAILAEEMNFASRVEIMTLDSQPGILSVDHLLECHVLTPRPLV